MQPALAADVVNPTAIHLHSHSPGGGIKVAQGRARVSIWWAWYMPTKYNINPFRPEVPTHTEKYIDISFVKFDYGPKFNP